MKRLLLAFLICALATAGLQAQQKTQFGFKAGPNISHLLVTRIPSQFGDIRLRQTYGFQAGLLAEQAFGEHLVVGAELLASQKGGTWATYPFERPARFDVKTELYYLNLPFYIRLVPAERWSVDLGVEGSYLLSSAQEELFTERADLGWLAGASFHISESFLASLRYIIGTVRVGEGAFTDEDTGVSGVVYMRNRSLQLSVGYFW